MNIAARRTSMADGPVDRAVPGANDNRRTMLSMGRSLFPSDAVARIYRPSRSATTSAPSRDQWKLVFEARSPSFIEPLMGYTGSRDTLKQVDLKFPTLASAIRYAQRQGLCYVVDVPKDKARITMDKSGEKRNTFSDATLGKLGLAGLSDKYRRAMSNDANRNDGDGGWASPMDVVTDNRLPLDARRSILMNWAWTEFLIDQATGRDSNRNYVVQTHCVSLLSRLRSPEADCHLTAPLRAVEGNSSIHETRKTLRPKCLSQDNASRQWSGALHDGLTEGDLTLNL